MLLMRQRLLYAGKLSTSYEPSNDIHLLFSSCFHFYDIFEDIFLDKHYLYETGLTVLYSLGFSMYPLQSVTAGLGQATLLVLRNIVSLMLIFRP